jgi:hypothetical protein
LTVGGGFSSSIIAFTRSSTVGGRFAANGPVSLMLVLRLILDPLCQSPRAPAPQQCDG